MQLIDTHVHINFKNFDADRQAVSQRWREAGVVGLVHSCVEPSEFAQMQALADQFPELYLSVGLHPLDADKWTQQTEAEVFSSAQNERRVVAIGEMGLDFYKAENQQQQKMVFAAQLAIAHQLNKSIIIHCRDAAAAMREQLQDFWQQVGAVKGVMHCWSGNPEEMKWFLDLGFYISFSGIVTFKKATDVQESARLVPSDRLLVETDCPFLAPVPHRGQRNEPAFVRQVAEYVAQLRGVSLEAIATQTTHNACKLFNLGIAPPAIG